MISAWWLIPAVIAGAVLFVALLMIDINDRSV